MELNFYSSLIIAGIVQGFFLSLFILLFAKHRTRASNYLGVLILFITLSNLQELFWEIDLVDSYEYFLLYLPFSFAEAALLYFFVMTYLYPKRTNSKVEKLLYTPFLIMLPITLLFKIGYWGFELNHPFNISMFRVVDFVDNYGDFLSIILSISVLVILWGAIENYQKQDSAYNSGVVKTKLQWLKVLLILLILSMVLWIYATIKAASNDSYSSDVLLVGISVIIYAMGYIGTRKIEVQEQRKNIRKFGERLIDYSIADVSKSKHIQSIEKLLIEEKRFLDPTVTLDSLALELNLSRGHLSRIINSELNTTFSDYINLLRVNEAKMYLQQEEFSNYTLVAIGLEAGFNSKTTFNNAFKKFTGVTPSAFKKLHLHSHTQS